MKETKLRRGAPLEARYSILSQGPRQCVVVGGAPSYQQSWRKCQQSKTSRAHPYPYQEPGHPPPGLSAAATA